MKLTRAKGRENLHLLQVCPLFSFQQLSPLLSHSSFFSSFELRLSLNSLCSPVVFLQPCPLLHFRLFRLPGNHHLFSSPLSSVLLSFPLASHCFPLLLYLILSLRLFLSLSLSLSLSLHLSISLSPLSLSLLFFLCLSLTLSNSGHRSYF